MGLCILIELGLQLGDLGLFDIPRFRAQVYEYAGFWPGLLVNWRPNYPFQTSLMFLTYGFLHAGLWHLTLNMITLWSLSGAVSARVGSVKFLTIYALSILGGGAGYAIFADTFRPMVGASGALFGLAGAILAWEYVDRFLLRKGLWPGRRCCWPVSTWRFITQWAACWPGRRISAASSPDGSRPCWSIHERAPIRGAKPTTDHRRMGDVHAG